jgi:hypothetical protein
MKPCMTCFAALTFLLLQASSSSSLFRILTIMHHGRSTVAYTVYVSCPLTRSTRTAHSTMAVGIMSRWTRFASPLSASSLLRRSTGCKQGRKSNCKEGVDKKEYKVRRRSDKGR